MIYKFHIYKVPSLNIANFILALSMKEIRLVADHAWSYLESWMTGSTSEDGVGCSIFKITMR